MKKRIVVMDCLLWQFCCWQAAGRTSGSGNEPEYEIEVQAEETDAETEIETETGNRYRN